MPDRKPLCVGSVFSGPGPIAKKWYELQQRYLRASCDFGFDHIAAIHGIELPEHFEPSTERLLICEHQLVAGKLGGLHISGLQCLLDRFMQLRDRYEYFLFLDMDAFPIRKDWLAVISERLTAKRDMAIPTLKWQQTTIGKNLIGNMEGDIIMVSHQSTSLREKVYVMIRSNKYQVHPFFCGVYHDLFYHHTGSCWHFTPGAVTPPAWTYWSHCEPADYSHPRLTDELHADPNPFIHKLAGWNPELYAKV